MNGSTLFRGAALAALVIAAAAGPARAADDLWTLGMDLERSRAASGPERTAMLDKLERAMAASERSGGSSEREAGIRFLAGEIDAERGDYAGAAEVFRKLARSHDAAAYADDAALELIAALSAEGADDEARRELARWDKSYPGSPLLPEARLAAAWNAIRRGDPKEARTILADAGGKFPWMKQDPRVSLALATACFLNGDAAATLATLTDRNTGPGASYLRALALARQGSVIKAAAQYQQMADRYPSSPLRDYALLAKANTFLASGAFPSAADEFERVAGQASSPVIRTEASFRGAAAACLAGRDEDGINRLRDVIDKNSRTDAAARAQFFLGEVMYRQKSYADAVREYNRVLTSYFDHAIAATAQYRVAQSLDALGRQAEATSSYQAVVTGYPLAPEAPVSAYLAGVGLLEQKRPREAARYFQLVIDRYASKDSSGAVAFTSPERQEIVEAALCQLELSYHRAGDLGQLSGVPHLMLTRMPPTTSRWRAHALLIDADALAGTARFDEAQRELQQLLNGFGGDPLAIPATRLLAWIYAAKGENELAMKTEEEVLTKYASLPNGPGLQSGYLNRAHILFNRKSYKEAAAAYDDFAVRFADSPDHLLALYQSGICQLRLGHSGDAVDRWETVIKADPGAEIAEKAWTRAGYVYFSTHHYADARRCFEGLTQHFPQSASAATGFLRIAQCEYNSGHDAAAIELFADVESRFPGSDAAREAAEGMQQSLYRLGQASGGTDALADLVTKYPNGAFAADAQFQIASHLYDEKRWPEAAEAFRRVVSQFPGHASADRAQYYMAESYRQAGSSPDARAAYEQFLVFFPESELRTSAQFNLGNIHFADGDYMRAAVDFTGVADGDAPPELKSAALYNVGLCQRMLGQNQDARATLQRYRAAHPSGDPRDSDVAFQLGVIHETAGELDDAMREYERALAAQPSAETTPEIGYRLGYCREQKGDSEGAIRAFSVAISTSDKQQPYRLNALARCAALLEKKGERTRAAAAYRDLARNTTDPELTVAARERAAELEGRTKK